MGCDVNRIREPVYKELLVCAQTSNMEKMLKLRQLKAEVLSKEEDKNEMQNQLSHINIRIRKLNDQLAMGADIQEKINASIEARNSLQIRIQRLKNDQKDIAIRIFKMQF